MSLHRSLLTTASLAAFLSLSNAAPTYAQAKPQDTNPTAAQSAVQAEQPRTVTIKVTRNGVIRPLEIVIDGDKYQLRAQRLPSFALQAEMPVVVTNDDLFSVEGNFRSFSGARTSGVAVSGGDNYPKDKAIYLIDNMLDQRELSNLLGSNNYVKFNMNIRSKSQPGESLKLPVVVVSNNASLRKRIDELTQYQSQASDLAKQLSEYQTKLSDAENAIKSLTSHVALDKEKLGSLEQRTKQLEAERQNYDNQLRGLGELNKQYSDRLEALLHELKSEKFLFFGGYGAGNLSNELGKGLTAELKTRAIDLQGAFNSDRFFAYVAALLASGSGEVTTNRGTAGRMDLTRNTARFLGQYSIFEIGNAAGGISGMYLIDKITQRGYLFDLRNPQDPSKRNEFAGNGNMMEARIGGFVGYNDGDNRFAGAIHFGNSDLRGREFNFNLSGLADSEYFSMIAGVDVTKFDGTNSYPGGTDIHAKISAALSKGVKGWRPVVGVEYGQMGPHHNTTMTAGVGRTFEKHIKYTP